MHHSTRMYFTISRLIRQSLLDLSVGLGLDVPFGVAGAERAPDERVPRRVVRLQPPHEPEAARDRSEVSLAGLEVVNGRVGVMTRVTR